jgi:hypothetical protein
LSKGNLKVFKPNSAQPAPALEHIETGKRFALKEGPCFYHLAYIHFFKRRCGMTDLTFELADGRMLGYALYGPASGQPVLYFHGTPSSRLEPQLINVWGNSLDRLLQQYNICLVAIDRRGLAYLHNTKNARSPHLRRTPWHLCNI